MKRSTLRRLIILRRVGLILPIIFLVSSLQLVKIFASDHLTPTRGLSWEYGFVSEFELWIVNALPPVVVLGWVALIVFGADFFRIPRWREVAWYRRAAWVAIALASCAWLAIVIIHGGRWPNTGLV